MTVYDYSWSRPNPAMLGEGVIRYACQGPQGGKRLEADELATLHAAGLPVGHVGENTADPSSWTFQEFWSQHVNLGFPPDRPLYLAADEYIDPSHYGWIGDLLDNCVIPLQARGVYGGAPFVQWCIDNHHATWGWIASALSWSMPPPYSIQKAIELAPSAHLIQLVGTDVAGTDANKILKPDWGGWHPNQDPPSNPDDLEEEELFALLTVRNP